MLCMIVRLDDRRTTTTNDVNSGVHDVCEHNNNEACFCV
jgi:hypothetical protein